MNSLRRKMKDNSGFTLVEIAIVLVIIGLLIGGVLKGQEMIKNAKIKRVMKNGDELRAAIFTYQDRFGYLPGDDPRATTHLPGVALITNGGGNGQISTAEDEDLFAHLSGAGLITGSPAGYLGPPVTFPSHPFGGTYRVAYATIQGKVSHWIYYTVVPVDAALAIDTSLDDGDNTTGTIRASAAYTTTTPLTLYVDL